MHKKLLCRSLSLHQDHWVLFVLVLEPGASEITFHNTVVIGETHHTHTLTLTDTNMYYPFKCACPTHSHTFPGVAQVHRGYASVKYHSKEKKTTMPLQLFTRTETQRDDTKSCHSHPLQSDVVMLLNNDLRKFNIHRRRRNVQSLAF